MYATDFFTCIKSIQNDQETPPATSFLTSRITNQAIFNTTSKTSIRSPFGSEKTKGGNFTTPTPLCEKREKKFY